MKKILILLLLCTNAFAEEQDTCEILKDFATSLMTDHQKGKDIKQYLSDGGQLNENQYLLMSDMISNALEYPVYATDLMKQQAIDNYANEWKEDCERSGAEE